jgi:hypothetical protein
MCVRLMGLELGGVRGPEEEHCVVYVYVYV